MASGILPGRFALIIPRDQIGFCDICGVPFFSDRDARVHMGTPGHAEAVQAELTAERRRRDRLAFLHEDLDPEVTEHMRKVGKRMLEEGRMVVKPNERAGFS